MPNEFNSRTHQTATERRLIAVGILVILVVGLVFAAFRLGAGAVFAALGGFALIGLMVALVWLALKVIEWAGGT